MRASRLYELPVMLHLCSCLIDTASLPSSYLLIYYSSAPPGDTDTDGDTANQT